MNEIPDDIRETAKTVYREFCGALGYDEFIIARAILAERERCARIADHFALHFDDPCDTAYDIARIIRKPDAA